MISEGEDQKTQQRVRCVFAKMHILNSRPHKILYQEPVQRILSDHLASFPNKKKKPNERLVKMQFLKNSKLVVLGYNKASERGDINFIDVGESRMVEFFYNQLQGGLGGLSCFEDGKNILIADRKGAFTFIDLSKAFNINDMKDKIVQTELDGLLDICISPSQSKVACGMSDKRCVIIDIEKERAQKKFPLQKKFERHIHGVNSINWHPYRRLIVSSSIDLNDKIRLWDPHSEELIHETNYHKNIITKSMMNPLGNSYFSLGKDNMALEYDFRYKGILNRFITEGEPTHLEVMENGGVVVSDSGGAMNWFTEVGQLVKSVKGNCGVCLFSIDQTNSILLVGRERDHLFQVYTQRKCLDLNLH